MRACVGCCLLGLLLLGCGSSADTAVPAATINPLLERIAAGGSARERAVEELGTVLEKPDRPVRADEGQVVAALSAVLDDVEPRIGRGAPTCGSWADGERYAGDRLAAELVIDLAGRAAARKALPRALATRDPYLEAWALRAADALGVEPPPGALRRVAADDLARAVLYDTPALVDRLAPAARGLPARARADMVRWLAYPTELGCQPERIELMDAIDDDGRYFVFRFRAGGETGGDARRFNAGISGPWNDDGELANASATFSDFEPAASATARGHLKRIRAIAG